MIHVSQSVLWSHCVNVECDAGYSTCEQVLLVQLCEAWAAVHVSVILNVVGISVPCLVMLAIVLDVITYSSHQMT